MVSRSQPSLSEHAHHSGRHQTRSERRQRDAGEAEREEADAHHISAGPGHDERDRRHKVSRVLGSHAKGSEKRVRRGHPSRSGAGQTQTETQNVPLLVVSFSYFILLYHSYILICIENEDSHEHKK